jgi:hypothetical protein
MAYTTIDKPSDYFNTVFILVDGTSTELLQELAFSA